MWYFWGGQYNCFTSTCRRIHKTGEGCSQFGRRYGRGSKRKSTTTKGWLWLRDQRTYNKQTPPKTQKRKETRADNESNLSHPPTANNLRVLQTTAPRYQSTPHLHSRFKWNKAAALIAARLWPALPLSFPVSPVKTNAKLLRKARGGWSLLTATHCQVEEQLRQEDCAVLSPSERPPPLSHPTQCTRLANT